MGEACTALDYPVVSGNVSLYNETEGRAILPTPVIGGVGLIDDLSRMATVPFKAEGHTLVLIGETAGHLGRSAYLRQVLGRDDGPAPAVDLDIERRNGDLVRALIGDGLVAACHDISDGGLAVAVAEMAMAAGIGATLAPPAGLSIPLHAWLYGEDQARYVLAVADAEAVLARARAAKVPAVRIGATGGQAITLPGCRDLPLAELTTAHEDWLPAYMGG
jgi:phosphoribosylformylglycinamidine synthase